MIFIFIVFCEYVLGGGTGSFNKHLAKKHGITKETHAASGSGTTSGSGQQQWATDFPGGPGGTPFRYNRDEMIDEFSKYVIGDELPFNHGESHRYEYFNRKCLQPQFRAIPRNTLKRRTIKLYEAKRYELTQMFKTFDGRVSLTTDIWSAPPHLEPYMCVTAHWIDRNWSIQKRIIAFELMPERHTGENIKYRLVEICKEWNLLDKIFSCSTDNASANIKCMELLYNEPAFTRILGGSLLHVRCCAHIVNLSCQAGIKNLSDLLGPIRDIVKWLRLGHVKRRYKQLCAQYELRKVYWVLDTPTRWGSTHDLLKKAIAYRPVITQLYSEFTDSHISISDDTWDLAIGVQKLLEAYVHATKIFSYVYQPNVHLVISECVTVFYHLHSYSYEDTNIFLKPILEEMMNKWKTYFNDFPYIYGIATILDPCFKTEALSKIIGFYYQALNRPATDVHNYVGNCKKLLVDLYDHYSSIYNPSRDTSRRASVSARPDYYNPVIANIMSRDDTFLGLGSSSSSSTASYLEVDNYLKHHFEIDLSNYNILEWWREKSVKYPILSRIAKDILAIPASTVASESAFSAGKRVLDEKRSRLAPHSIQICVCKKDWDQAEVRMQGERDEDDEEEDDPWMMMDTSASSGAESGEASNQPNDDDE
jgi:hAT family protein/uncharacterized protein DUF4413